MFQRLFRRERQANETIVDGLYGAIVAAARQPALYSDWNVPDMPLGRFEMISLHLMLVLRRLRGHAGVPAEIAQALVDTYFLEVDHSLRELGIGDVGVPKRMKKLARMFYGRAASYGAAIDEGNAAELAAALGRNITPGTGDLDAAALASYVLRADAELQNQPIEALASGALAFPSLHGPKP